MARLDLSSLLTTTPPEPVWIVQDIIPAGTMIVVAGDAGVGKSVLNLSEGLHIALGQDFLGHPTLQQRVLYFDEENSLPDLSAYLQHLWVGMGCPDPLTLTETFQLEHFSLGRPDWYQRMTQIVMAYQPGMIYVDTATSVFAIKDENSNAEAQEIGRALRHLMQSCAVPPALKILKHAKYQAAGGDGSGGSRRAIRGAKCWLGVADQVLFHIAEGAGRPRADGLRNTVLFADKLRAFGLREHLRIIPEIVPGPPRGLILRAEPFAPTRDLMRIE